MERKYVKPKSSSRKKTFDQLDLDLSNCGEKKKREGNFPAVPDACLIVDKRSIRFEVAKISVYVLNPSS